MVAIDQFQMANAIHLQPHATNSDGAKDAKEVKDSEASIQEAATRKAAHDRFCEDFISLMNRAHRSIRIQMMLHSFVIPFSEQDKSVVKKYFLSNWTAITEFYQDNNKTILPEVLEVGSMTDLVRILSVWVAEEVMNIETKTPVNTHNKEYQMLLDEKVLPIFKQFEIEKSPVLMPTPGQLSFAQLIRVCV